MYSIYSAGYFLLYSYRLSNVATDITQHCVVSHYGNCKMANSTHQCVWAIR